MSIQTLLKFFPGKNLVEKGHGLYTKLPPGLFQKLEEENFRKTVRFVYEHSQFYRRTFNELKIDVRKVKIPTDMGDFFTTPEDIRQNPQDFVCSKPDTAYETTGTMSKKPKRVYFSRTEVKEAGFAGAVGLWGLGVRPKDRVASAFDNSFWVSGPVLSASCEALGCFHFEAGRLDPNDFYDRVAAYGVTVIVGDPSWLVRLSEVAQKRGPWKLKLMIGGGENLTEEARRYCENVWKTDFILSYGQTEAIGAIGLESLAKDGYHLNEFHNFFEIINPDENGYGELVYTNLNRRVMPLVRYRSGDITRYLQAPSSPEANPSLRWIRRWTNPPQADKNGLPGRRIEKLKGRVDEWTVTAMGNIAPWMFEPVFAGIPGLGTDWQIVVEKSGIKDKVIFVVESSTQECALKNRIIEKLQIEFKEQTRQRDMGLLSWDVQVVLPGTLRAGQRKLKRIVDRRKF